jgi:PAS domain S-box-containing protein
VEEAESRRELAELRRQLEQARGRIAELEALEADCRQAEQAVRSSQEQLERVIAECKRAEATLEEQAQRLGERVKELDCLYGISQLVERPGISLPQIIQGIVDLLPAAWQVPEAACACAVLEGQRFTTANHVESPWKQRCEIVVHGRVAGHLQVCYVEQIPERDEGPFLEEERTLLQAVAERLGRIVERKGLERELRVKDSAIASSINAIALADLQANLTYANTALLRLWGYDREGDVLGQPAASFLDDPEQAAAIVAAVRAEGSWVGELQARRKDGSRFHVQLSASMVTDDAGQPICFMGSLADITGRKEAQEALQKGEERFRRVFFDAPFPIMIHAEGGEVVGINRVWTELTGYAHADMPTISDWTQRAYGERSKSVEADIDRLYSLDERVQEGEHVLTTQTGEKRTWEFISAPLGALPDGRRLVMSMAMDVTERKQAEEALRHYAAELQARNEELDAFAHTVAHDLKNPLSRIVGFAELLKDDYDTFTDEEIRQRLGTIARNGHRMRGIVDELLFLSSVRKAEDVAVQPLDMAAIVAEALDRLAPMVREHGAEVLVPETWPRACGYAPWIEEVWANYLSNALKYGGLPPRVELGADPRPGSVRFWVRDNGPGLTEDQQARLFTPFTRLSQTRAPGHGLGLSIVQRIAEKLGGEVGVESEPGRGSLFYFVLPQTGRE